MVIFYNFSKGGRYLIVSEVLSWKGFWKVLTLNINSLGSCLIAKRGTMYEAQKKYREHLRIWLYRNRTQYKTITSKTSGTMVWNGDWSNTQWGATGYRINAGSGGNFATGWNGFTLESYQDVYIQFTKVTSGDYPYVNFGNNIDYNANGNGVKKISNPNSGTYSGHQGSVYVSGGTNSNWIIQSCYIMNTDGTISDEKYWGQ